jgi:hypothetical protein
LSLPCVTNIGGGGGVQSGAFAACGNLSALSLPCVTNIGGGGGIQSGAFVLCQNLSTLSLPCVTNIGGGGGDASGAFFACSNLSALSLPCVTNIGDAGTDNLGAFSGCNALTKLHMPKIRNINDYIFNGLRVTQLCLPSAEIIGRNAFNNCNLLTHLDLPNAERIGDRAFNGCTGLTEIIIPKSVTYIGERAFNNTGMRTVYFLAHDNITVGFNAFYTNSDKFTTTIDTVYIKNIYKAQEYAQLLCLDVNVFRQYIPNYVPYIIKGGLATIALFGSGYICKQFMYIEQRKKHNNKKKNIVIRVI